MWGRQVGYRDQPEEASGDRTLESAAKFIISQISMNPEWFAHALRSCILGGIAGHTACGQPGVFDFALRPSYWSLTAVRCATAANVPTSTLRGTGQAS